MKGVALQGEVECVSRDLSGGLQPGSQRELSRFAGVGRRKQPMLDLSGKLQRDGALSPLKQVGEPAVDDDDIRQRMRGQRMRGQRNIGHALLVRFVSGPADAGHTRGASVGIVAQSHPTPGQASDELGAT